MSPWWWDTFLLPPVDVGPIDTVAPSAPTVTSGPTASTDTDGDLSFAWTNAEAGGTNECSLDTGTPSYSSCAPPEDYLNRAADSYTFRVRQVDAAGNAGNAVTRSFTVGAPYPGTRFYKTTGVQLWSSENVTAARVQNLYNAHMGPAHHGADDSTDFVVRTHIRWKDELVDENSSPTLAQMRDPNWGGYKWNHPGTYPEASEIDNMLDATCVQKGRCKVAVSMSLAATGGEDPPNFIATNSRWAWTGQDGLVRLKYYDATARRYAEAFTLAAMERFDDPRVSSWKLQEYFSGATNLPADWDRDSYISGYETYLRNVEAGAPRDARNDRVMIYQTNPITKAGLLGQRDFSGMMIGLADSDPQFFEEPATLTALRENLHGVVPMSTGLDVVQFNRHYQTTYPESFPNP